MEKWKYLAAKLKEITENEKNEPELSSAADKAYKIMVLETRDVLTSQGPWGDGFAFAEIGRYDSS